jgi:hypothetical protein
MSDPHRTLIECGQNCDTQMQAVNKHLVSMGWPGVSQGEIDEIKSHANLKWTTSVVSSWEKQRLSAKI